MRAYTMAVESRSPRNHKQLDGYCNEDAVFMAPEKKEQIFIKPKLRLAKKYKETLVSVALNGVNRLRNDGVVASPSDPSGIEDSLTETILANQEFSVKDQRLNPNLLDTENVDTSHELGINTYLPLQDSEPNMVKTTKEELERKDRRKLSKKSRLRKQNEDAKLLESMKKLKKENSEFHKMLLRIAEECQELTRENDDLLEGLEEIYGPDAINYLRARNPASANNGKTSSSGNNSTADEDRDTPTSHSD